MSAIELVEKLADCHDLRVDRAEINHWLPEGGLETQDDVLAWLVSTGMRVGIRIGYVDCAYADIAAFAKHGIPIAVRVPDGPSSAEDESADSGRWVLITKFKRRRFHVEEIGALGEPRRISGANLRHLIGAVGNNRIRVLMAQHLEADPIERTRSSLTSKKPQIRLLRLFKPDAGDIWAIVVFSLVVGVVTLAAPLAVEALVNTLAFGRYVQPVLVLALIVFIFLGFAAMLRLLLSIIAELLQRRLFVRVAEDLGYRLPRVARSSLDGQYAPELVNRFLDVANIQKTSASLLLDGIALVVASVVGMAVLGFYHSFLLGFDIIMLAMMAFTIFVLGRGAVGTAKYESKAKYKLTAWLEDLVRCPTAFSLHGGQRFALERSDRLAVEYLDSRRAHFRVLLRQISFALVMYATSLTVLLGLGGWLVIIGELTLGQLVAAELIVGVVVGAFAKMGKHMESYYDMLASVDKVGVLVDLPMESLGGPLQIDGAEPVQLVISDVSASVSKRKVFTGLSVKPAKAGMTAVVGPPGSGKSVLMDLLAGRRQPSKGEIVFDGTAINQLDVETLRQQIGMSRGVEIFSGTLSENVHLFRPQIRMADVRDALELVGLTEEIRGLPDALETHLDSSGAPLSNDQMLRLMIARAIVGRPRLLLIDGTLDAISDQGQADILERLTEKPQPWTLVVATGRAAIRERAESVLDLQHGTVKKAEGEGQR